MEIFETLITEIENLRHDVDSLKKVIFDIQGQLADLRAGTKRISAESSATPQHDPIAVRRALHDAAVAADRARTVVSQEERNYASGLIPPGALRLVQDRKRREEDES